MNTKEEIIKLKALLEQGAITQEEFNNLSEKLESSIEEEKPNTSTGESSIQIQEELNIISDLKRIPENVVSAGYSIRSAISAQVASYIFNAIGVILFFVFFFSSASAIINGRGLDRIIGDNPSFYFAASGFIIGFILWISSLRKFNKAGLFLMRSEASYYGRNIIKVEPNRKKVESNGLKVGQEFAGGIIAYFDKTGEYVGIVSKSDLPEKLNLQQSKIKCEKHISDGYSDWFLPDKDELEIAYNNLIEKQLTDFKKEIYWANNNGISLHKFVDFSGKDTGYWELPDVNNVRPMRLVKIG